MTGFGSPSPQHLAEVLGHELRNPLASAVASLSVVAAMTESGDPRADFLSQAMADLSRASKTLSGYLTLARSKDFPRIPLDLCELAERIRERYPERDIHLAPQAEFPPVNGDAALLERTFENLLDNAFEAGADRVTMTLSADHAGVRIEIRDNGRGIPGELCGSVFEPHVSGRGSSGLGLSIVRDIVRAHDGDVACQTTESGTVFRIGLPRA